MGNKWMNAAIPALLIHCSIGTVYCWSTIKEAIAQEIGMSTFATGWAFSLAIFFLGTSAAFAGNIVEMNVHRSSLIACIFFTVGMIGTGMAIQFTTGMTALCLIYLFYGCIMGIGLGVGYLTPVKTLMLWFDKQKGLATGISITGFGLAKAIATPIMEFLQSHYGIAGMFYLLGVVYFVMIYGGHRLLKKPKGWVEQSVAESQFRVKELLKDKNFILIWIMFYINIHCGLMVISYEKQFLENVFAGSTMLFAIISVIPSVTAICNALGRLGYSTISDLMKDRVSVYKIIFSTCIAVTAITSVLMLTSSTTTKAFIVITLMVINLGYGGGFSTLPALLSQFFGMKNISKIHGIALTAWAVAGISGNNLSEMILTFGKSNYTFIIMVTVVLYLVAFIASWQLKIKNS